MLQQFTQHRFEETYNQTCILDHGRKDLTVSDLLITLILWDVADSGVLMPHSLSYLQIAVGVLIVYDVTKRESFEHVPRWLKEVKIATDSEVIICLVGNKSDLNER